MIKYVYIDIYELNFNVGTYKGKTKQIQCNQNLEK